MIGIFGFVTGAVNVWLLARRNIWDIAKSGRYGDAGLQIVYLTVGIYGWRVWLRRRRECGMALPLYICKGLLLISGLNFVFLLLCVFGLPPMEARADKRGGLNFVVTMAERQGFEGSTGF